MSISVAIKMDDKESYETICDELADILDVPEEKREALCETLKSLIEYCMESYE